MSETRAVAIFGSSAIEPGARHWTDAQDAGARLAQEGITVITGGYGGIMEAASTGASQAGGRVIGVTSTALFPHRSGPNPHVSEEIDANSLTDRLGILTGHARGAVVFPGSVGTATELLVAWNLNHVARNVDGSRFPTVAIGDGWRALWDLMTSRLGASGEDVHFAESSEKAVDWLLAQPEIR